MQATRLAEDAGAGAPSDFLSSIELFVVDRADMLTMQNWTHVESVAEALNALPRSQHGSDIMRVREWYLNGMAKHYRQTLLLRCVPCLCLSACAVSQGVALRLPAV